MITQTDEGGKKIYTCELCQKSYSRSNSLRRHLLVHTGEKAYACDLCDKKFSIKSYLTAHRKIHSGETPFGCTLCFKQFNRVSNLRAHMLVHTGLKPHSCEVCGKLFNLSSNLKRHMTIHSGLKPHVCTVCGKEFGLSSSLKEHMRVHTGENPYKCELCGKVFKQHSNFRRHKSIHSGEKKHVCYICNKAFNQSGSLKRHLTIHPETAGVLDYESQLDGLEGLENDESLLEEGEIDPADIKMENPDYVEDHGMSDNISETINRIVESHASENDSAVEEISDTAADQGTNRNDLESNTENYYSQLQNERSMIKKEIDLDEQTPSDIVKIDVNGLTGKNTKTPKKAASSNDLINYVAEKHKKDKRKSKPFKVASFSDLNLNVDGEFSQDNADQRFYDKLSLEPDVTSNYSPDTVKNMNEQNAFLEQQNIPADYSQHSDPGYIPHSNADGSLAISGSQNFMPQMNNIPVEIPPNANQPNIPTGSDPRFPPQSNTYESGNQMIMPPMNNVSMSETGGITSPTDAPNTSSKEDQMKQMEWYHKQYNM